MNRIAGKPVSESFIIILALALFLPIAVKSQDNRISIIPEPVDLTFQKGVFTLDSKCKIIFDQENSELSKIVSIFSGEILENTGRKINISYTNNRGGKKIYLELVKNKGVREEAYDLKITKSYIKISAVSSNGLFYGLQTLEQIIMTNHRDNSTLLIPCLEIKDWPNFSYRGMHLDVSRHFFSADSIKRYIDFLALYKFNYFHWHLTDDQGWRIEIKKYPELTRIGAWRKPGLTGDPETESIADNSPLYGGFYTQQEIREIVQYARERYITIVPEIEMPGHVQASIAAYPELGVTGKKLEVKRNWGISPNIYNPFNVTFVFLKNVLDEVMDLFPSEYIHIGGDEAIKAQWKESEAVQARIQELGLKDEQELQSWFIGQIGSYLNEHGRKIIGWDEIMEGGLVPGATVMSWRGVKGGIEAVKMGHNVVMTPNTHLYLNFSQTENEPTPWAKRHVTKLEKVYSFNPVPSELSKSESKYIIGTQGCVWTEHISSFKRAEHMLFPRITAVSEIAWSPRDNMDFTRYKERLKDHIRIFEMLDINYYPEDI